MTTQPPVKQVVDGASRSRGDENRSHKWFKPKKRRSTVYEEVTVDTQPSPERHLERGFYMAFEDGTETWSLDSTLLKSTDWFDFRDPGEEWERTFFQKGAQRERELDSAVQHARDEGLLDDLTPEWVEFLRNTLGVSAFPEHAIWRALAWCARDALSDTVAHALVLNAGHKQRHAQAVVLYEMDLDEHLGGFSIEESKRRFLNDDAWQPVRELVEKLLTIRDWGEVIVACNLVVEPVIGTLIRREMLLRPASFHGDGVTSTVMRAGEIDWLYNSTWSQEFARFVVEDAEHGVANKQQMSAWVADWMGHTTRAAHALEPIFERIPAGEPFAPIVARVIDDAAATLSAIGIGEAPTASSGQVAEVAS